MIPRAFGRPPIVALTRVLRPLGESISDLLADLGWDMGTHLRNVDREGPVVIAGEMDGNAKQLGMFVACPQVAPPAGLEETMVAVKIEALLRVPVSRPRRVFP